MILRFLVWWLASAVSLLVVAYLLPGFHVAGVETALKAAIVIGLVNGTIGLILKVVTFPLTLVTLGLMWVIVNGLMLMLASNFVIGFKVDGLLWAMLASLVLTVVNWVLKSVFDSLVGKA